ncbi:transporter, major facilitator family protein [Ancylostoma duodenale]|uniref:Transporter, major facilitator family protein n=1 Tax=Ancylostoma duodenale TaxID=51022 RepID=A0A0C2H6G7_9BILA|nr:transporter, major facilitator family protein [Ancylostoma duodenale]
MLKGNDTTGEAATTVRSEWRRIWLAFFGFYILLTETGVRHVMNIFVPSIMEEYNCTKTEADAVVIVVPTASSLMAGPIAAMFYQFAGARITIVSGALLCFLGFSVGSIAPSMPILSIFAVLIGVGCALMRNAIISVQCEYFTAKRNTVMSFISIGPGIGIFVLPRILVPLINGFSWSVGFQFLAALYIISGAMAMFITKRSALQHHSFAHFTGLKVWTHLEFWFHAVASFCASAVCIIYVSNILGLMREEDISQPEVVYSYHGIASIVGRALLTILMGLTDVHIAVVMIFNYVVAQSAIFAGAFCYTTWEFRFQNFFAGFGIGKERVTQQTGWDVQIPPANIDSGRFTTQELHPCDVHCCGHSLPFSPVKNG